jgi:hypothetical protein
VTVAEFAFREITSNVDPRSPLIYMWEIHDKGGLLITCYVGKSSGGASRPRNAYARNVRRMRAGEPWHGNPKRSYRAIHHALSDAVDKGYTVTLTLLCNVESGNINEVERAQRLRYGCAGS